MFTTRALHLALTIFLFASAFAENLRQRRSSEGPLKADYLAPQGDQHYQQAMKHMSEAGEILEQYGLSQPNLNTRVGSCFWSAQWCEQQGDASRNSLASGNKPRRNSQR